MAAGELRTEHLATHVMSLKDHFAEHAGWGGLSGRGRSPTHVELNALLSLRDPSSEAATARNLAPNWRQ